MNWTGGSYNERQHGILHLPKGASWQSRGCWVFSAPTGEVLKRNGLEMAVEWGGGGRQWHRKMAGNLWRSGGARQTGNQWGESGRWRINEHWLGVLLVLRAWKWWKINASPWAMHWEMSDKQEWAELKGLQTRIFIEMSSSSFKLASLGAFGTNVGIAGKTGRLGTSQTSLPYADKGIVGEIKMIQTLRHKWMVSVFRANYKQFFVQNNTLTHVTHKRSTPVKSALLGHLVIAWRYTMWQHSYK